MPAELPMKSINLNVTVKSELLKFFESGFQQDMILGLNFEPQPQSGGTDMLEVEVEVEVAEHSF